MGDLNQKCQWLNWNLSQQEIKDVENQYSLVIPIGGLHPPNNYNFLEAVVDALKRVKFLLPFLDGGQGEGRLNVQAFVAFVAHEIHL